MEQDSPGLGCEVNHFSASWCVSVSLLSCLLRKGTRGNPDQRAKGHALHSHCYSTVVHILGIVVCQGIGLRTCRLPIHIHPYFVSQRAWLKPKFAHLSFGSLLHFLLHSAPETSLEQVCEASWATLLHIPASDSVHIVLP